MVSNVGEFREMAQGMVANLDKIDEANGGTSLSCLMARALEPLARRVLLCNDLDARDIFDLPAEGIVPTAIQVDLYRLKFSNYDPYFPEEG